MSEKKLIGSTALITGGTRGIGKAIALKMAESGADIAFTYLSSDEAAAKLKEDCEALGVKAMGFKCNGADFLATEKMVQDVLNQYGKIDVLVNNAGITRDNLLLRMSEMQWDEVMTSNLKSVYNITKHVVREMLLNRKGSIINMTSVVGIAGNPGQANYAASKAGIIGFSKSIAAEIGSRQVRCNAIAPGFIQTDMTQNLNETQQKALLQSIPLQRLGKVEEVANLALFLASDDSSYITGQVISVCGGMSR